MFHNLFKNEFNVPGNVVTAEAFGFLDGYSDGEGTDFMGSGEITPTQVRGKAECITLIFEYLKRLSLQL